MPSIEQEPANSGLSLVQIWLICRAYWKHIAIIVASIILLTAVAIKMLPKSYTATATLMVNIQMNDPMQGGQQAPAPVPFMSTQVQLMQSAEVLLPVIDQLHLTQNKDYIAGYSGKGTLPDWVKEKLVKDLDIEVGAQGSQLIYVAVTALDPKLAAQIANTLVENYLNQERQRLSGPASDRAKRYLQELAELKQKVNVAQDQVTRFRQRTGVTESANPNATNVEATLLASLETRYQEVQNLRRAAEVKAAENQRVAPDATASATIASLRTQINTEKAQLAELRGTLGSQHPKVLELENQLNANQRILDSEFNSFSEGATSELTASRQLEAKLKAAVDEQRAKVLANSKLQDEGTKYLLELESAQAVYKRALDQYDQIMFVSGEHLTTLASRAVPPQTPSKPDKPKLMIAGIFFALLIGLAVPVGYELLIDRRIRCPDDFERGFAVPVLMEFESIATPLARGAA